MSMETVIRTRAELRALKTRAARRGLRRVALELPGAPPAELRAAERAINKGLRACGCEVGAALTMAGLAAVVLFFLLRPGRYDPTAPRTLICVFGFLCATALAGKMAGLVWAEWRLRSSIRRVAGGRARRAPLS
jgi:hypothetical protein